MTRACAAILLLLSTAAHSDPVRLRIGTMAPEGSGWAREMHNFTRDVAATTNGQVDLKWYLGGITGDEFEAVARMKRGQLDGAGLSLGCEQLSPSLRALRVVGMIQSREESRYVLARLRPRIDQEMAKNGYVNLGVGNFGSVGILSRTPVRTLSDLAALKMWVWDRDTLTVGMLRDMGLKPAPMVVEQAGPAFDDKRIDGFLAVPGAALVFQWSTRARYYTDFATGLLPACFVVSQRAFDALPVDHRKILAGAAAKFVARFDEVGAELDRQLVNGLFEKQGLKKVHPDSTFITDFLEAAHRARDRIDGQQVPSALLNDILRMLADVRAENPALRR